MINTSSSLLPDGREFSFWEKETAYDCEYHVDCENELASDDNDGSEERPFRTINRAAELAEPGTRIVVHPGLYRECVMPRRGGSSPEKMISYEAMPGVIVSGSVVARDITPATHLMHDIRIPLWTIRLDPADFSGYNPFCANNLIHMREFLVLTRENQKNHLARRGVVFMDGKPLEQVETVRELDSAAGTYYVEANGMVVHFRPFDDVDPREYLVELTAKEQNFVPAEPYLGYIKVKGFHFTHAATGHPFPQRGAVSTYRGNHWIIEDNVIEWSNCLGMDVGNEDPSYDVRHLPADKVPGWTIVRRNEIRDCGVGGLAGYVANEILVEDNLISGTGWLMTWHPSESGAIKFHIAKRCLIRRNIIEKMRCGNGIWLDCNNDFNRITQNLLINNEDPDPRVIHIECTKEYPNLIDNNIIWDFRKLVPDETVDWLELRDEDVRSQTGAIMSMGSDDIWAYNNLIGKCTVGVNLYSVFCRMGSGRGGTAREARIMNNMFYDCSDSAMRLEDEHNTSDGNLFVSMVPGYLRIRYPLPSKLLNLAAWQRFFDMDPNGTDGRFKISVDEEKYELTFLPEDPDFGIDDWKHRISPSQNPIVESVDAIRLVSTEEMAGYDYFGNERGEKSLPGPFVSIKEGITISIDPRRK